MSALGNFKASFASELGKYAAKVVYLVVLVLLGFALHALAS